MSERPSVILVVDDDAAVRLLVGEVCRSQGYQVVEAATGLSAIDAATDRPPDLVLLDWTLPDLSGLDVCRRLRQQGVSVPVVMLTGHSRDEDVEAALQAGADDYLTKPVNTRQLPARIAAHLRREAIGGVELDRKAEKRLTTLGQVSVFFMQPPTVLRRVAKAAREIGFKRGDTLIHEGAANSKLFVIVRGRCQASVRSEAGGRLPVAVLGSLDLVGAVSLVTGDPARATVEALDDVAAIVIERDSLGPLLAERQPVPGQLQRVASQRQALLDGIAERSWTRAGTGQIILVYSTKGGAGKTTLALNLAAALAARHPGDVALIDVGLPYCDAALLAGLVPTTCVTRIGVPADDFDSRVLAAALHHPTKFFLLPVVLKPEESDLVTAKLVQAVIVPLRRDFAFVVVDCPVQLSEATLAVFELAQQVVVITTPRLPSLRDLPHLLAILQDVFHIPYAQIHIVVNQPTPKPVVALADIEQVTGRPVAVEIGFDAAADKAALEGDLLWQYAPRGPIARGASALAKVLGRTES